eukprot:Tbor_TRINITY_DN687_c0_g1::TRINITY_DN687_c0_g1_i1::g.1587::m.1587/K16186/RRAGC_D; Ras-related GTP-binding protein C/D
MSDDTSSMGFGTGLPKVLLMGLRRSGKSSIRKVVFEKVPPHETTFIPTTTKIETEDIDDTFVKFQVKDFPGQIDPFDKENAATLSLYKPEKIFQNCGAVVFVMDCDQHLVEAQNRLLSTILAAHEVGCEANIEVFIHKVDEIENDKRNDIYRKIKRYIDDALGSKKKELEKKIYYNLTTIFDNSVFQAFSLVVQNLIKKQMPYIVELLTMLKNQSKLEHVFLLDRTSKIYLAKDEDAAPECYELLGDALEVFEEFSDVYTCGVPLASYAAQGNSTGSRSGIHLSTGAPNDGVSGCNDVNDNTDRDSIEQHNHHPLLQLPPRAAALLDTSSGIIELSGGRLIFIKHLENPLVLAGEVMEKDFSNRTLIDYNVAIFGEAVAKVFEAVERRR